MKSIYNYLDYRDYLRDHFNEEKSQKSYYSYRYVAQRTAIDAGYYVRILQKQNHLGDSKIDELVNFLKLQGRKKEYFKTLVTFNRTKNTTLIKELFNKLLSLKNTVSKEVSDFNYFTPWYNIPVRELLYNYNFDGDFKKLGKQFVPPLKESEVKDAIKNLKKLKMVVKNSEGFLRPKDNLITSGDQWGSAAIRNFQKKMISLAEESIERTPREKRDISTMTVNTTWKNLELITERLAQARREITELIASDSESDEVFQINLQIFPLTAREDK